MFGFAGPQAHIVMIRNEIMKKRKWVDAAQFDEDLGLCEALPGNASSQMAISLGWLQRGGLGGLSSGFSFLLPGLLIVLLMSELWRQGQGIESFRSSLDVIEAVIAAIIWAFTWKLIKKNAHWQVTTAALVIFGVLVNIF